MNWRRLFSKCLFSHAEPIKVVRGKKLHFECSACQQDLGPVLPKQKFKARKPQRIGKVVSMSAARAK